MPVDTIRQAQTLVQSYKDAGKSLQEALSEIQNVMEDEEALAGIVKGLEDVEAGRTRPLNAEYIRESQAEFANKIGL